MTAARRGTPPRSWIAALVCAIAASSCTKGLPAKAAVVGARAPTYAARSLTGDSVSLDALRGKVVLVNVWATWCHPCRDEIPLLEMLHRHHSAEGLAVVGVSVDAAGDAAGIHQFMQDFGMTYAVWLDPGERVSAQFRTFGVPESFLIDRAGVIRWRKIGALEAGDTTLSIALTRALRT